MQHSEIQKKATKSDVKMAFAKCGIMLEERKTFVGLYGIGGGLLRFGFASLRTYPAFFVEFCGYGTTHARRMYGPKLAARQEEHMNRKRRFCAKKGAILLKIKYNEDVYRKVRHFIKYHRVRLKGSNKPPAPIDETTKIIF